MTMRLRPAGEHATILDVAADVQVQGKIATLGHFAIKRKAKDTVEKFARNISAELQLSVTSSGRHA
jgi:carbon monoxide dehydrogenase subunit G